MKITKIEPFLLHVPVSRGGIADAYHSLTHWGAPGVRIHTDVGITGYGYTGTHAELALDKLVVGVIEYYGGLLADADPLETAALWERLDKDSPSLWVGRGGITTLARSAIDVALWDIKAKIAELPLWKLLGGGSEKRVAAYNTDGGWINFDRETLVADMKRAVDAGFRGVKMKVGQPDAEEDVRRIAAAREAVGPGIQLMVDANGRLGYAEAVALGRRLPEFGVRWFEEPMWFDDLPGHRRLQADLTTAVALGEQFYSRDNFRDFIDADAVRYVQADAVRLAGVTEFLQVADYAGMKHLPVVPHVGDMMQVHWHLTRAHAACTELEYIPWMQDCFEEPAEVGDGFFRVPQKPGAGTTLKEDTLERYGVRL